MKSDRFFSGDQYFFPTNNFTRLKLTPTKNFYQLFSLLNKILLLLKFSYPEQKTFEKMTNFVYPLMLMTKKAVIKKKLVSHTAADQTEFQRNKKSFLTYDVKNLISAK